MKVAICCVAIGKSYLEEYTRLFRPSHEYYAKKHGYDLKVISEYQSDLVHPEALCFQKYLLCSNPWSAEYDYIVYLDADILINPSSPPMPFAALGDKIGMVDEYSQPTPAARIDYQKRFGADQGWETSATGYIKKHLGVVFETNCVFNGGVVVFQPRLHRELCEHIFSSYAHQNIGHKAGFHYEQATTNVELQKRDMVHTMPNEFDRIWNIVRNLNTSTLDECFTANYFLHFAGHMSYDRVEALFKRHLPSVGGFYQCHKQKPAFSHAIRSFRAVYPESSLNVFNDGGDESLGDIARECSATYTYCQRASISAKGVQFADPAGAMAWIGRLRQAVTNSTEDYIMLIEDDVWTKKPTYPHTLKHDICGVNVEIGEQALDSVRNAIYTACPSMRGKPLALAGFGGCMLRRSFFKRIFADMGPINLYVHHYYNIGAPKMSDCILSFLTYIHGGTTGMYDGYCETWWPDFKDRVQSDRVEVLHQYKSLYV